MAVATIAGADAAATASAQGSTSAGAKLFGGKGVSFMDILRIAGGGLIGGPIGAGIAFASVLAEKVFRKDDAPEAAATAAEPPAQAVVQTAPEIRPGGWMVNMAYGGRDPYQWTPSARIDAAGGAPDARVAANTAINDPRLPAAAAVVKERPGGWIINATYSAQDAYEETRNALLSRLRAEA
ncbi:MAG: hypothetical protein IT496_07060 [Gammaproteobacteria bacterium]|nr:hypothetical protein [Gammaproteobacteria bacterium]